MFDKKVTETVIKTFVKVQQTTDNNKRMETKLNARQAEMLEAELEEYVAVNGPSADESAQEGELEVRIEGLNIWVVFSMLCVNQWASRSRYDEERSGGATYSVKIKEVTATDEDGEDVTLNLPDYTLEYAY